MTATLAQRYLRPSEIIRPEHLIQISGDGPYSCLHFADGTTTIFSWSLKRFAEQYPYLLRIHKQLLVNPANITSWERVNQRTLRVEVAGMPHWVARRRVVAVAKQLSQ